MKKVIIKPLQEADRPAVIDMMRDFYHSPAVISSGTEEIYQRDFDACLDETSPLHGYLILDEADGDTSFSPRILGYTMVADGYSTENAMPLIWIEDLYLKEEYRNQQIGTQVLKQFARMFPDCILKLEVEKENEQAVHTYRKNGWQTLAYDVMICRPLSRCT